MFNTFIRRINFYNIIFIVLLFFSLIRNNILRFLLRFICYSYTIFVIYLYFFISSLFLLNNLFISIFFNFIIFIFLNLNTLIIIIVIIVNCYRISFILNFIRVILWLILIYHIILLFISFWGYHVILLYWNVLLLYYLHLLLMVVNIYINIIFTIWNLFLWVLLA